MKDRAEGAAGASRARLEDALRMAGLATWEWDLATDVITWSDELYRMFGREPGAFRPSLDRILEAMHAEDRERVRELLAAAGTGGEGFECEYRLVDPLGRLRWMRLVARMESGGEGRRGRLLGIAQDITPLREAEADRAALTARYRRLFEQAPVSLWEEDVSEVLTALDRLREEGVTDLGAHLDGHPGLLAELVAKVRVLDVNPATLELYGAPSKEAFLGPLSVPLNDANTAGLRAILQALFEGRTRLQVQRRDDVPGRPPRHLLVTMNLPRSGEDGGIALVSLVDLSARLEAEEALRDREADLSRALAAARMGAWRWDMRTGVVAWSPEVFAIMGPGGKGFRGDLESYMQTLHPDDLPILQASIEEAIAGSGDYAVEVRLRPFEDGSVRWVAGQGRVEFSADGTPVALHGLVWDVTDHRNAEQALRETEARLAWVVDHAPLVVFALDAEGRFTLSVGRALGALGLRPGQVVGSSVFEVYRDFPELLGHVRRAREGEEVAATVRVGGVVFDTLYHPVRGADGQVNGVVGIATDITGAVTARAEQTKLVALVDGSGDFIGLASPEGMLTFLNPAGLVLVGLDPDDRAPRPLSSFVVEPGILEAEILPALETSGSWKGEVVLRRLDTGAHVPCFANVFRILEPGSGSTLAVALVLRDLREEREAARERDRMQRQLRQAQKMETIGTLAGGIAHDFNNLLTPILGYADMLQEDIGPGTDAFKDLEEIIRAASRAKDLVQQILSFSRRRDQDDRPLDVAPVLREAVRLLRAGLPSSIEIRLRVEEGCGWVKGDATQLHQVILNLATNAVHAMRDRNGVLGLELAEVEVDELFTLAHPDLVPGPHLRLIVSDTGTGMPPHVLERVLEPFFTTKAPGEGTGLGLSVVHGIVSAHRGALAFETEEGVGTRVSVYLPVTEREAGVGGAAGGPEGSRLRLRVLVVDDRDDIASLTRRMLVSLGHEAEAAFGPDEALTRIRARPDYFDVLLTDYSMPGMDGLDLIRKVREIRPLLPAVLASGFGEALTPERLEAEGVGAFLMKPFVAKELARALEQAAGR